MTKVLIGGVERTTAAPLAFRQWRKAWPAFGRVVQQSDDGLDNVEAMVEMVAAALEKAPKPEDRLSLDEIFDQLTVLELNQLQEAVLSILEENGFNMGEARAVAAQATAVSTETSTESSVAS